ncbi:ABC transporter ATP-binding protein/permease [Candidatus Saccharibacteria bacterium]|nr:ABC transporter ATP-binding protein/permease [Candidatus Saccharibacteria bacterium]
MLEIRGVSRVYQTGGQVVKALDHVSVNFRESEFVAILGPSGSGKTTLLNIIGGLDEYTDGDLIINEKSTKKFKDKDWDSYRNHRVGFVFQSYNLIPHQTVLNNVRLALTLSGISKAEGEKRAKKALKEVGLAKQIYKHPMQLSGGQMQRVAIARALVNDPDILLADEPTGALDSETSVAVMDLLKKVAEKRLVVMVTHNPELAKEYATRIVNIKDGQIVADSDPYDGSKKTDLDLMEAEKKSKKTKMSFLTATKLSFSNLMTKKARTLLVALAGSIGIIGIALISAVSTGFQNYIDTIENDTLTSYPLALNEEATDVTGVLLSMTENNTKATQNGEIHENQLLTSMLGNISTNDLKSFREYYDSRSSELKNDVKLIENVYSVQPLIYTKDAAGKIAKLNPSDLFESMFGSDSLMSSSALSSYTSIFTQYNEANLRSDFDVVAGRYPENYDEVVVVLNNPGKISDLLTYSLGFRDTEELTKIMTEVMSGNAVDIKNDPLTLKNEDLLNHEFHLIYPTDLYRYNSSYDIYENMVSDKDYLADVYNKSEKLKVVGILTPNTYPTIATDGVYYLPSLTRHIIEHAEGTEAVKKQLRSPDYDIFSGKKFGEEKNDFSFQFSDLVSVDNAAIQSAFGTTIDQNAITARVGEYMSGISNDISVDTAPIKDALINRFKSLTGGLTSFIRGVDGKGTYKLSEIETKVNDYLNTEDFSDLYNAYYLPPEQAKQVYAGLLATVLKTYGEAYISQMQAMGFPTEDIAIPDDTALMTITNAMLARTEVDNIFNKIATPLTEVGVKQKVLGAVGNLTAYLTSSFAGVFHVDESKLLGAFHLKFSEDELTRIVTQMFTTKEATQKNNLIALGYQNLSEPTRMRIFFNSFEGKTKFINFLDGYNNMKEAAHEDDKVISYTDTTGILMSSVETIVDAVSYVLIAFVSISLVVSSIMIGVITYISVYERTKEIGILRAMGASKRNISEIFNAETFIIGLLSGLIGVGISYLLIPVINLVLHQFIGDIPLNAALAPTTAITLIIISVILTVIGGLIPAGKAAKRDPVVALRSE